MQKEDIYNMTYKQNFHKHAYKDTLHFNSNRESSPIDWVNIFKKEKNQQHFTSVYPEFVCLFCNSATATQSRRYIIIIGPFRAMGRITEITASKRFI